MRILHLAHDQNWFKDHFEFVAKQLGHDVEFQGVPDYCLTKEKADIWWQEHKEYCQGFDAVFVSHLASLARIFLQNDWKKPLYIWLCFRFDYFSPDNGHEDMAAYRSLMRQARLKPNVKFFAASEHDRIHAQAVLSEFPVEIVPPMVYINNKNKVPIRCGSDTFFMVSKHNETVFMDLKKELDELEIPAYKHRWSYGAPDLTGVRGIIHIPYTFLTRGLYENLALENVFFLPTLKFFNQLRSSSGYFFWDVETPTDPKLAEWYNDEYRDLFNYFNSFEELKSFSDNPNLSIWIDIKKRRIREFNRWHNAETLTKWRNVLGGKDAAI